MFIKAAYPRVVFMIVTIMYWISMYIYVPVLSPYLSDRGMSLQLIGIILGSYGFVQMLVRFPVGLSSDRWGRRKPFLVIGLLCGGLSCVLFTIPGSWVWPLAGRIVAGVCASTWVVFTVMYAGFYAEGDTTRAMGNISVMTVTGQLIGMGLSGWLVHSYGTKEMFLVGAVVGLLGLLLALTLREPDRRDAGRVPMSLSKLKEVVRTKTLLQVSVLSLLAHGILFITMFGFTPLKAEQLGASALQLTLIVFSFMVPHALASFITAARVAPRLGHWRTVLVGFLLSGGCTIAIAYSPSLEWLMVTQAVNGFAQGMTIPLLLGLSIRDVALPARATAMGLYQSVYSIGMFAGPFAAGWLNDNLGLNSGFWLGGLLGAAAAMLAVWWEASDRRAASRSSSTSSSLEG
ncbi:MFS transporter [Paenibacillus sp. GCM10023252]|uniref:MFS transporter n=1 Tax=Paenibacillus sp. GCM10023252 TaxID=3252649 RepID=UPI003623F8EA